MNDEELLTAYVREGSQDAFAELVRRHIGLVYATAIRRVRGADSAQEVTQHVFCVLARKAGALRNPRCLPAWLHQTSLQLSALHIRSEQRRIQREHAAAMNLHEPSSGETEETLEAWLDQALRGLDESDRTALLLRYFESQSMARVGEALGISEAAAKMRIHRALEKLRSGFARHGVTCSAAALIVFLEAQARASVPEATTTIVMSATRGLVPEPVGIGSSVLAVLHRMRVPMAVATLALLGLWVALPRLNTTEPSGESQSASSDPTSAASVDSAASDGSSQPEPAAPSLRVKVLDAESELPLAGVTVRAQEIAGSAPPQTAVTGADGVVALSRPVIRGDFYFGITARREGYVSQSSSWSRFQRDAPGDIPTSHIIRMSRGVRVGGLVQDSEGRPVSDAQVTLRGNFRWRGVPPRDRASLDEAGRESVSTDSEGRWRYSGLPSDWSRTEIQVQAPGFVEARFVMDTLDQNPIGVVRLSSAALLAETAVIPLVSGLPVVGRVEGPLGNPVPAARIVQNRAWGEAHRSTDSAEDGSFQFRNLSEGTHTLTVQAPGFAATPVEVAVPVASLVVVRLAPGRVIRARVVDGQGDPVVGAQVECAAPPMQRSDYELDLKTDAEGRFSWNQAPGADVSVVVHHAAFLPETVTIPTDGVEATIVLKPRPDHQALRVTGRVVDAESGRSVDRFRVLVGEGEDVVKQGEAGAFAFTVWESEASVEIRAPGYAPARQDLSRNGSDTCSMEFRLVASVGWSGQVLLPDGTPAPGTEVALMTANKRPTLGNRRFMDRDLALVVTTDVDGAFAFDPEPPELPAGRMLVAVSQAGYAEHDADTFRQGQILTLQPWGRIEGVVRGRSTFPPELRVHVAARPWLPWMPVPADPSHFGASPDEQGRFTIESVPPGYYSVGLIPHGSGPIDKRLTFQLLPGKVTRLEIPDLKRSASGRLVTSVVPPDFNFAQSTGVLERRQTTPVDLPRLRRQDFPSDEAFTRANQEHTAKLIAYWKSATGLSAWMEQRYYAVRLESDGRWVAPAVSPGDFDLKVVAQDQPPGMPFGGKSYFLKSVHPVRIGMTAEGLDEPAVELGPIPMEREY